MYRVLSNFILKNNEDTLISEDVSQMILLNPNKQYYLMMYKYGFSNVFANITSDLYISPGNSWIFNSIPIPEKVITAPLCADIPYLIKQIQEATLNQMILNITAYGKIEITFDPSVSTVNIPAANLGILATDYLGRFVNGITSTSPVTSPAIPVISPFNYMVLTCNLVDTNSYIKTLSNYKLTPTTAICSNSAALEPFTYNEWVSRTNVIFPISSGNIQKICFELVDENLKKLVKVPGAQTDFNINFAIIEMF
jgi:hypothetical protein